MSVTRLEIVARTPYEDGTAFGDAGAYERIDGVLHFAADPTHPANTQVVDLDKAARDSEGRVRFAADICIVRPVNPARGNGGLLLDVVNRGNKTILGTFNRALRPVIPDSLVRPGDGFLMRHGWTLAFCGWQWDVHRSEALMGLDAPVARDGAGNPLAGDVQVRFQTNAPTPDHLLADRTHQPYPAADVHQPDAILQVRDWPDGPATVIARDRWRFARDADGRPVADDSHVWLEGGFVAGRVYEVVYRTRACPVVGAGMLAIRDAASFLRYGDETTGNPVAGALTHALGFGISQSGRFLRTFLYHGMNVDERGRKVFDGLIPHVCGAWRGQFNHRYAQPSDQHSRGFIHLPPFHDQPLTDPETGGTAGLLDRLREADAVPLIFYTNTAAEYWRGDASLIHTDMAGAHDVEPVETTRIYHFAGTQHGAGMLPVMRVSPVDGSTGANDFNLLDYRPLLRAALVNLQRWVLRRDPPPASVFPRLDDGTAIPAREVAKAFSRFPTAAAPNPDLVPLMPRLDLGPEAAGGIGRYPAVTGELWPTYVAAIDDDGNELGGIRLPDVSVPVATYAGWNPRDPDTGGAGQILPMVGSTVPFAATRDERARTADPRPSIAERYRDRDAYEAGVREATDHLIAQGYVLAEDRELVVENTLARYDVFAAQLVAG